MSVCLPAAEWARDVTWEQKRALDRLFSLNTYFTLGCAALSLLFAIAGHVKLDATTLTLIAVIAGAGALFHTRAGWLSMPRYDLPKELLPRAVVIGFIAMIFLNFMGALSPEVRHDPLFYHLEVPRLWLNFGRMVEIPENGHSYFPYGFEMLYAWGLSLGDDSSAKVLHCLAGLSSAIWCSRIAKNLGASPLYAGAFFYFIHFISYLSTTTYIDLATAMYALAAFAIISECAEGLTRTAALAAGFLAGSAMATKYTAWPIVGAAAGAGVLLSARKDLRAFPAFAIAAAIPLLPWIVRDCVYVGNPIAPLMIKTFGPESAIRSGLAGSFDSFAGSASDPMSLLLAPFVYTRHLMLQKFTMSILGFVAAALLTYFSMRKRDMEWVRLRILFIMLAAGYLAEAYFTRGHPDGRYGLPSMGIGAVLVATFCARLSTHSGRRSACFAAPLLCLAFFASALVDRAQFQRDLNERWIPILDPVKRDAYRSERGTQPSYFNEMERLLTAQRAGRVLGIGYPSRHRYWVWIQGMRNDPVAGAGGANATPERIHEALARLDFTHVVNETNPGFEKENWAAFLAEFTRDAEFSPARVRSVNPLTTPAP